MSTMSTAVGSAMDKLMLFAADSGTFEPVAESIVSCYFRIDRAEFRDPEDMETLAHGVEIRCLALIADLGKIPVVKDRNNPGDKFRQSGQLYEVTSIIERNNHFVTCAVREVSG